MIRSADIEEAFRAACAEEIATPKPGNVHIRGAGHGMTGQDFLVSATAAAPPLCARGAPLGIRVLGAVSATREAIGMNTNLGIILLCAPLAMAAEFEGDLQHCVGRACQGADVADAEQVFRAIVHAAPGGLGDAPRHDVRAPARVRLVEAMSEAADRDRIAHQYVTGFADVFDGAIEAYEAALRRWPDRVWATLAAYLHHLATAPDSHIVRKRGIAPAHKAQQAAEAMRARLCESHEPSVLLPSLLAWDEQLKRDGLNPGTSADLTVATVFSHRLVALG